MLLAVNGKQREVEGSPTILEFLQANQINHLGGTQRDPAVSG